MFDHCPRVNAVGGNQPHYVTAADIKESSECLIEQELKGIKHRLADTGHCENTLMGLALSGGGIRSATFCLGVLQSLAAGNNLKKMDYLSTVSGGGYIGSSLSWWLKQGDDTIGLNRDDFPYGSTQSPEPLNDSPQLQRLRYLRQHGKFLTPGAGITVLSGVSIVLRSTILSLTVWLSALVLIMLAAMQYPVTWTTTLGGTAAPLWKVFVYDRAEQPFFLTLSMIAAGLVVLFLVFSLFYSLFTSRPGILGRATGGRKGGGYRLRRFFEQSTGILIALVAILFVVASIPVVADVSQTGSKVGGPVGVLIGFLSATWSFFKAGQKHAGKIPVRLLAAGGAFVLVYGLWLTAFAIAAALHTHLAVPPLNWVILTTVAFLTVGIGWFANINYVSMHRYYRDRLMETFLPNPKCAYANQTAAATKADPFCLSQANNAARENGGPYHIINTNVILVDSKRRRWRIRGGDNFILSPLLCGSNATGWQDTEDFMGDRMTLATAMAISGAAANPNTGVGGDGLTRNRAVSVLMSILNLRLGYWAHNPTQPPWPFFRRPNYLRPGAYEFFGAAKLGGMHERRPFVQLSDGGHFENLALYELIRRKLRLIICCDASADPGFDFANLQTAIRRAEEDFGATITFAYDQRPAELVPTLDAGYPMGTKIAARGHIVGDIKYCDETFGKLILLKTTMVPGLPTTVKGYKGANGAFPDQPTSDQFFDEDQFEAYRELGYHIAKTMSARLNLPQLIRDLEAAAGRRVPNPPN